MNDLKNTTELVKAILITDNQARNSDSYLYLKVINHIAGAHGISLHNLSVPEFLLNGADMGFVGFETVRRTRQKVQQHHPELASTERVSALRAVNEAAFREYARGVVE